MNKTLIAIDPGKNGGIAWQHPGEVVYCLGMPATEGDILFFLRKVTTRQSIVILEDLVKFIGPLPASTMAVYAGNFGFIKGAVMMAGIPLHLAPVRTWASQIGLGTRGKMSKVEWKNKLKAKSQQLYPHLDVTFKTSDALLILHWANQQPQFKE